MSTSLSSFLPWLPVPLFLVISCGIVQRPADDQEGSGGSGGRSTGGEGSDPGNLGGAMDHHSSGGSVGGQLAGQGGGEGSEEGDGDGDGDGDDDPSSSPRTCSVLGPEQSFYASVMIDGERLEGVVHTEGEDSQNNVLAVTRGYLVKFSPSGRQLWAEPLKLDEQRLPDQLTVDEKDNLYWTMSDYCSYVPSELVKYSSCGVFSARVQLDNPVERMVADGEGHLYMIERTFWGCSVLSDAFLSRYSDVGDLQWRFPLGASRQSFLSIANGVLIVASSDPGSIARHSTESGEVLWSHPIAEVDADSETVPNPDQDRVMAVRALENQEVRLVTDHSMAIYSAEGIEQRVWENNIRDSRYESIDSAAIGAYGEVVWAWWYMEDTEDPSSHTYTESFDESGGYLGSTERPSSDFTISDGFLLMGGASREYPPYEEYDYYYVAFVRKFELP